MKRSKHREQGSAGLRKEKQSSKGQNKAAAESSGGMFTRDDRLPQPFCMASEALKWIKAGGSASRPASRLPFWRRDVSLPGQRSRSGYRG